MHCRLSTLEREVVNQFTSMGYLTELSLERDIICEYKLQHLLSDPCARLHAVPPREVKPRLYLVPIHFLSSPERPA
jgi:hypothetical protein